MIRIRKSILLSIVVPAILASTSHAVASPSSLDVRSKAVGYGDLNLATPHGIATLDRRIGSAINEVCNQSSPRDLASFSEQRRCQRQAWAGVSLQRSQAIASASNSSTQLAARGQ